MKWSKVTSFIAEGTRLKGVLRIKNELRIDGSLEGSLFSESMVSLGETAEIKSDIFAQGVVSSGKIHGNVHASHLVHLEMPAKMVGDIETVDLQIAKGVYFTGHCHQKPV